MRYDKLVRDKIPEILEKKEIKFSIKEAWEHEIQRRVINKLKEEVDEFLKATSSEERLWEIWDIVEVLRFFCLKNWISWESVEDSRLRKYTERGWFDKWIVLIETED